VDRSSSKRPVSSLIDTPNLARDEAGGSLLQLLLNVAVLTVIGLGMLRALRWLWSRIDAQDGRPPSGSPAPIATGPRPSGGAATVARRLIRPG
jgi:hypothetical protein